MLPAPKNAPEKLPNRQTLRQRAIDFGVDCLEAGDGQALQARIVASKIGVSVGSFYNLFGDIDTYYGDIFALLFEELLDIAKDRLAQDSNMSPQMRLARLASSFCDVVGANEAGWRALLLSSLNENSPPKLVAQESEWRDLFVDVLQQGNKDKSREHCAFDANILWGALRGMVLHSLAVQTLSETMRDSLEKAFGAIVRDFATPTENAL